MLLFLLAITGTVTGATSRWVGDVIVTDAVIRDDSGATTTVVQLGGSVDGLGMAFSHVPAIVAPGDRVTIDAVTRTVIDVAPGAAFASPVAGTATYGVQRTAKSGIALWRSGGCFELVYDADSIDADRAKVIDAAFAAWSSAAASCGQLSATSTRRPNPPSARDEMSTVRIRNDRWCNPGNALEAAVCYPKEASAVTRLLFIDDPSDVDDGKIIEADIELNAVDYVLLAPGATAPSTTKPVLDLQAVATHEAGHALGLAHNCGTGQEAWPTDHAGNAVPACTDAPPQLRAATMFYAVTPGDVGPRSVELTDVAGVCELARELTCEPFVAGGCNTLHNSSSVWLVLAALVLLRRRIRRGYDREPAMTSPLPQRIQRFEVREHLGSGGMGSVYRAYDPQLDRDVAIKVLRDPSIMQATLSPDDTLDLRSDARTSTDELLREARMMAQLSHPNVLPVYEVGLVDSSLFVVMEHIAGCDMATWLRARRTPAEIVAAFAQAARGLAAAHARGIVHRDFKPANVLCGNDGRVRVADFGLSAMTTAKAMVRIDDGRGTPRFMAPELWSGAPASAKSDVYAFCVAIDEALGARLEETAAAREDRLRGHGLSRHLRATIAAGLSTNPQARPDLAQIASALDGTPRSRRGWWIAAGMFAVVVAGTAAAFTFAPTQDTCDVMPAAFDPARRARLIAAQVQHRELAGVVGRMSRLDAMIHSELVRTCVAERDKQITPAQANARRACLQRRGFELIATAERLTASTVEPMFRVGRIGSPASCEEMTAGPLQVDPAEVAALWMRFVRAFELSKQTANEYTAYIAELESLAADATRAGEQELAIKTTHALGTMWMYLGKIDAADTKYNEVYVVATQIKATAYAASALLDRAKVAQRRSELRSAEEFVRMAQDLADKPTSTPLLRATIYRGLGYTAKERGDNVTALKHYETALALIEKTKGNEVVELELLNQVASTIAALDNRRKDSVAAARKSVARAREVVGEHHKDYAHALNVLAITLLANGDRQGALEERKRALDVFSEALPPDHPNAVFARTDYAYDLLLAGRPAEAAEHYRAALAVDNPTVKQFRAFGITMLGVATFDMGRHREGLDLVREGVEAMTSQYGDGNARVMFGVGVLANIEIELGLLDDAKRTVKTLARIIDKQPPDKHRRRAHFQGTIASLLELRLGNAQKAEQLTREALATMRELEASSDDVVTLRAMLAETLLAQHRVAEARVEIDAALAAAAKAGVTPEYTAVYEVTLAKVEAAEGNVAAAAERARRLAKQLERHPKHIHAIADAARLAGAR